MRQDRVDRPGAGGEKLDVLEAWRGEAVPCMRGLMVLPENHQPKTRRDGDSETGLTGLGRGATGSFEAGDTRRDRGACVGGKQGPVDACPLDELNDVLTKTPLRGLVL